MDSFKYISEIYGDELRQMCFLDVDEHVLNLRRLLFAQSMWLLDVGSENTDYFESVDEDYTSGGKVNLRGLPNIELSHEVEADVFERARSLYYLPIIELVEICNNATRYISGNDPMELFAFVSHMASNIDAGEVDFSITHLNVALGSSKVPCLRVTMDDIVTVDFLFNTQGAVGMRILDKLGHFTIDVDARLAVYTRLRSLCEKAVVQRSPIGGASGFSVSINEDYADLH